MSAPQQQWPPAQPPKKRRKWPFVLGGLVVLGVIIGVSSGGGDPAPAATASAPKVETPAVQQSGTDVITYEVTGKGTAGNITYVKDSNMGMQQANGVDLPWKKDVSMDGGAFTFQPLTLSAQSGSGGGGDISCRILRNGEEVTSSTSSGPYAVVTCSGN